MPRLFAKGLKIEKSYMFMVTTGGGERRSYIRRLA
jgi:hypothetical protein